MLQSLAVPGWLWARQSLASSSRNSREARLAVSGCPALHLPARADFGGGARAGLWAERPESAGVVVSGLGRRAERGAIQQSYLGRRRLASGCGHPLGSPPPASLPREPSRAAGKPQREGALAQDTVAAWGTGLRNWGRVRSKPFPFF